jgi:hypothetical protein
MMYILHTESLTCTFCGLVCSLQRLPPILEGLVISIGGELFKHWP